MEYYSAIKKNEIMPFAVTWMDLEIIILSDKRQKDKYYMTSLMYHIFFIHSPVSGHLDCFHALFLIFNEYSMV